MDDAAFNAPKREGGGGGGAADVFGTFEKLNGLVDGRVVAKEPNEVDG